MTAKINRVGKRYGRLLVLREVEPKVHPSGHISLHWLCRCSCGVEKVVSGKALGGGLTLSCGCYSAEIASDRATTHGMSRTPEHKSWCHMIGRCHNPNNSAYPEYGGRGIYVCEEWRNSFEAFYAHVGPKPTPKHSIDRINNDDGYRPGNVRWATSVEQRHNQRPHRVAIITHCFRGHEYTPENTYTQPGTNNRHCKICRDIREARRARRTRKKAA